VSGDTEKREGWNMGKLRRSDGRRRAARILVGAVSAVTSVGAVTADFLVPVTARQHMRNPRWPGHAKFHDAQYIVMSGLLGALGMRLVTSRNGDPDRNLLVAAAVVATPWLGMYGATLFPGTAVVDEEFAEADSKVLGVDGNIFIAGASLTALAAAVVLSRAARS
jgi:hypothetical protein